MEESKKSKIPTYARHYLAYAIGELSKALATREEENWDYQVVSSVRQAQHWLSEFYGSTSAKPEISEDEAEISRNLHTYMRKAMDCPLSCMLYRMIDDDKGKNIWLYFVKGLSTHNFNFRKSIGVVAAAYDDGARTHEELMMKGLLELWMENGGQEDVDYVKKEWMGK